MGTNYYVVPNRPSVHGGIHIGKSSIGWLFLFQSQHETWNDPPIVWHSWPAVKDWLQKYTVDSTNYVIVDEYDEIISFADFIDLVESKQHDEHCRRNPDNFSCSRNVGGYRFTDYDFL